MLDLFKGGKLHFEKNLKIIANHPLAPLTSKFLSRMKEFKM
jgi:hypothetical protein